MSYTVPPGSPGPAGPVPRPGTVTASSYLLYLIAALQVIGLILLLPILSTIREVYNDAFAGTPDAPENIGDVVAIVFVVVAVLFLLIFGGGFATLGILNGRGKNASRIVTWVVAGLSLCCFGPGLFGNALGGNFGNMGAGNTSGGPSQAEVQEKLTDAMPSWYGAYSVASSAIVVLSIIAVIVLLALPASNAFFRKPPPGPQAYLQPGYPPLGRP